jgi:hypothetical protein
MWELAGRSWNTWRRTKILRHGLYGVLFTESRHLFRDFVDATAEVEVKESSLVLRSQKRAHNPLLIAAGFETPDVAIPWPGRKRLQLVFG